MSTLQLHEFYSKYANVPIKDRSIPFKADGGGHTLDTIYERLDELERAMQPFQLEIDKLLSWDVLQFLEKHQVGVSNDQN